MHIYRSMLYFYAAFGLQTATCCSLEKKLCVLMFGLIFFSRTLVSDVVVVELYTTCRCSVDGK